MNKENVQKIHIPLPFPEQHTFGDKQHIPATSYVGWLCAEFHLTLRNAFKVTDTTVVYFPHTERNTKERDRDLVKS